MDMNEFKEFMPNKFLVVLGKMHSTIFGIIERHLKDLGYNTTEFLTMYAIAANGALTIQDIAARIFVTSGNMTYTIDKLENKGIIKRISCSEDRRKIFIDFTDEGKDEWNRILDDHSQYLCETFSKIDETILLETINNMKHIGKSIN